MQLTFLLLEEMDICISQLLLSEIAFASVDSLTCKYANLVGLGYDGRGLWRIMACYGYLFRGTVNLAVVII
jgi:hypothetical protein